MLRNPYLNRSMIRSVGEFYGRRRELERAMARIGAPTPQSVSLVGERRAGKSSLLWHMAQPEVHGTYLEKPENHLFLMMDFQGLQHLDPAGFCRIFGQQLQQIAGATLQIPELEELSAIEAAVRQLTDADLRLVCLFDEFETITRNPDFGAEFFGFLRSLANVYPVAFVTASRCELQSLCHSEQIASSPFFNIFTQIHLGPMPESEVRELVAVPSAAAGIPLEPHTGAILSLSGSLPFFAQLACAAAFDCLQETGSDELDQERLAHRFLEEGHSHFEYLWETLDDPKRQAIGALVRGESLHEEQAAALQALEVDGYVLAVGSRKELFSRAFVRFVEEAASEAKAAEQRAEPEAGQQQAGDRWRRKRKYVVSGCMLGAALLVWMFYSILTKPHDPAATEQAPSAPGLHLLYEQVDKGRVVSRRKILVGPSGSAVQRVADFAPGGRFKFAFTARAASFLYVYHITADSNVVQLPDFALSSPVPLEAGVTYFLPPEPEQWYQVGERTRHGTVFFLSLPVRHRELEEIYQRFHQAAWQRKESYRRRLAKTIEGQAFGQVALPFAVLPAGN